MARSAHSDTENDRLNITPGPCGHNSSVAFPAPPRYMEWRPSPPLRRHVRCTWTAPPAPGDAEPVLPDGCMDLIWDGSSLFVAGPDTGPVPDERGAASAVGLRFQPGAAPLVLGPPAFELRDARVPLDALWRDAPALTDRLADAPSASAARGILEAAVSARLGGEHLPDPLVESAARSWRTDPTRPGAAWLAREAGVSPRQLLRRFSCAVGYGPKYLQRVLRFQAFLSLSATPAAGLADLAYRCGYADQAHLNRETAALAGRTPTQLRGARVGHVRNVQDGG